MSLSKVIVLFVIGILLTACSGQSTITVPSTQALQPSTDSTSYPAQVSPDDPNQGYPSPTVDLLDAVPTVDPSLGQVKGILQLNNKPVKDSLLFLADIIKDTTGADGLVSVDYNTPNRAVTNEEGEFVFYNVPLKRYALVIVVIPNSFLLMTPGTEDPILVDIDGPKEINLGVLNYDNLPLRGSE